MNRTHDSFFNFFLMFKDPRVFQVVFLGLLLLAGLLLRGFSLGLPQLFLAFAACLATQWFFIRFFNLRGVGYRSALITCLGLCLLLRSESLWVHPLAAFLAIGSKFILRCRGTHIYNPSNLGVTLGVLLLPGAWVTPGQWGYGLLGVAWFVALGAVVVQRSRSVDVSWAFLLFYLGALSARVLWYGQSWGVLVHQLNGSLLVFAFFMISDPLTIPQRRGARILYAALVAAGAYFWQYHLFFLNAWLWDSSARLLTRQALAEVYHVNGLLLALFLLSPAVPLLNRFWPGEKFRWTSSFSP